MDIGLSNNIICIIPLLLNAIPALQKARKGKFLLQEGASGRTSCKIHSFALVLQVGNGHFQLSVIEYPVHKFHFCNLKLCLSKLRSSSSQHEYRSLYYAPAPLTTHLEDIKKKKKRKEEKKWACSLIHTVQIKTFPLSDILWGAFTFPFFFPPNLFISAPLSVDLDGLPPSWRWLKVAALETVETN